MEQTAYYSRKEAHTMEIKAETLNEIIERMAEDCIAESKQKATASSDDTRFHAIEKYVRTAETDEHQNTNEEH